METDSGPTHKHISTGSSFTSLLVSSPPIFSFPPSSASTWPSSSPVSENTLSPVPSNSHPDTCSPDLDWYDRRRRNLRTHIASVHRALTRRSTRDPAHRQESSPSPSSSCRRRAGGGRRRRSSGRVLQDARALDGRFVVALGLADARMCGLFIRFDRWEKKSSIVRSVSVLRLPTFQSISALIQTSKQHSSARPSAAPTHLPSTTLPLSPPFPSYPRTDSSRAPPTPSQPPPYPLHPSRYLYRLWLSNSSWDLRCAPSTGAHGTLRSRVLCVGITLMGEGDK